jgi:hypothetical protein
VFLMYMANASCGHGQHKRDFARGRGKTFRDPRSKPIRLTSFLANALDQC